MNVELTGPETTVALITIQLIADTKQPMDSLYPSTPHLTVGANFYQQWAWLTQLLLGISQPHILQSSKVSPWGTMSSSCMQESPNVHVCG